LREDIIRSFSGRKAKILGHENTIKSAVLLPLFFDSGECYVLFEKRARTMKRQPGEICFPGGTREPSDFQLAKLYSISKSVLMFPEAPKSPSSYYQAQQISLECIP
jgi:8-oxo-dGTP pyrophosphatase MutT (NUDIX family)